MDSTQTLSRWEFLTPQEVSALLKVSVHTVRRWINEGSLPAYKVGRSWRIQRSELASWISGQQPAAETRD